MRIAPNWLTLFALAATAVNSVATGQLQVTRVSPSANHLAVPTTAPIRFEFDRPINPLTASQSIGVFGRWSGVSQGTFQFENGNRTVVFQPQQAFSAGEIVIASISNSLRAADNSPMRQGGYTTQFWTATQHVTNLTLMESSVLSTGTPSRPYGGVASDLNHDGWLDVTMVNEDTNDLRVFTNLGTGDGTFTPYAQPTYGVGSQASPSEVADFNRDGNTDITVANGQSNSISVLFGDGTGGYLAQQEIPVGTNPRGIAVLDVEGDGDLDIVNTNRASNSLSLHLNQGNGVFGTPANIANGISAEWSLGAGDMNNDGLMDLVVASGGNSNIQVLTGNGNGTFTPRTTRSTGGASWMLSLGDFNGDGFLDVSSANAQSNNGAILLGNGDGTLQPAQTYNIPAMGSGSNGFPLATDMGDLDGDGDLDWVTSSFNGEFVLLKNNGSGQFQFYAEYAAVTAASCGLLFDMDNDGDLDLGLIDELANRVALNKNVSSRVARGDFDADSDLDGTDIDRLVAAIANFSDDLRLDLTGDGVVDGEDLGEWLTLGGAANLPSGNPYLIGDGNLDGLVDGQDFGLWNNHKFTSNAAWTKGDFNADGQVDGSDFGLWNSRKFSNSDSSLVPEPMNAIVMSLGGIYWMRRRVN